LPTRNDLTTEWVIGSRENESINATGFTEGIRLSLAKVGTISKGFAVSVYRFSSANDADAYFGGIVYSWKNRGGYKEVSTSQISTQSYGILIESSTGDAMIIYAVKQNIFVQVQAGALSLLGDHDTALLAKIVIDKI